MKIYILCANYREFEHFKRLQNKYMRRHLKYINDGQDIRGTENPIIIKLEGYALRGDRLLDEFEAIEKTRYNTKVTGVIKN